MDCDELPDQLLKEETVLVVPSAETVPVRDDAKKREWLEALAPGGQPEQYLGRSVTADQVDIMTDDEAERLYARCEVRLGAAMTKTLKTAAQFYSATRYVPPAPPENKPKFVADPEADPFVEYALSTATGELYHKYGMFLAPLTAALTTAKHCQFRYVCPFAIPENVGRDPAGTAGESERPDAYDRRNDEGPKM